MASGPRVLGLLADPGVPQRVVDETAGEIGRRLSTRTGVSWRVEVSHLTFPLNDDGTVPFGRCASPILDSHGWRYLVYLTDLPRSLRRRPVLAEVDATQDAAMISLPALGAVNLHRAARDLIVDLVRAVTAHGQGPVSTSTLLEGLELPGLTIGRGLEAHTHYLVRTGPWARARQVAGMVRINRPGRLVMALTGGIAAAMASGGFGVFYGSIWSLSAALSPWRHALIGAAMVMTFTLWLITRNRLWFRPRAVTDSGRALIENTATTLTVLLSILVMYAVLFVGLGALSVVVIDAAYLSSQLGRAARPADYVAIASLSVSMGLLAGALGSNFDDTDAVRLATYSKRGHEQRQKLAEYDARHHDGRDGRDDLDPQDAQAMTADAGSAPSSDTRAAPTASADGENRSSEPDNRGNDLHRPPGSDR